MFKDLRYIKISISLILLFFVVSEVISSHKETQLVFKPNSFASNEAIKFKVASNQNIKNYPLQIKNKLNNLVVYDTTITIKKTYDFFDTLDFFVHGFPTQNNEYILHPKHLSSGIYEANRQFPLVIRGKGTETITVVIPTISNYFYTPIKEHSFFEQERPQLSLNRAINTDEWTKGLIPVFKKLEQKYSVNYLTDLDLEQKELFEQTSVVFLYGRLTFWSPLMLQNIMDYMEKGGKVLIASSNVFYAKFCMNYRDNIAEIRGCENTIGNHLQSWKTVLTDTSNIYRKLHSDYGGKTISPYGYTILQPKHPLLNNTNLAKTIDFWAEYTVGTPLKQEVGDSILPLYPNTSIIAYTPCKKTDKQSRVGGIILHRNSQGGAVLSLGSSDWCLPDNQNKPHIQQITLNAFDFLLSD